MRVPSRDRLTVSAIWGWIRLSSSKEDPPPRHVIFPRSKYKETYALFETERLVRKALFRYVGAVLPIAASPALQMGCLGAVVLTSLMLYCAARPYRTPEWNRNEIALLATTMYMVLMVSSLLANEIHWGHSVATQQFIIVSTLITGAVVGSCMSFRVFQELVQEQIRTASRATSLDSGGLAGRDVRDSRLQAHLQQSAAHGKRQLTLTGPPGSQSESRNPGCSHQTLA